MKASHIFALVILASLSAGAQKPFNQEFAPDVPPPEGFRKNRTSYSGVMDVLRPSRPQVTPAQVERLRDMPLEAIFEALGEYGSNHVRGFVSTRPGERLVGRALTMRYLPPRPDLRRAADALAAETDWHRQYYGRVTEEAQPGDVIVAELGGIDGANYAGSMAALGAKLRGAAGMVIDGGMRDPAELQGESFAGFPVLARFFDVKLSSWVGVEYNAPVRIGGVAVLPGDIVVGGEDGILFFPPELLETVIQKVTEREALEAYERDILLQKKYRWRDVYRAPWVKEEYEKKK